MSTRPAFSRPLRIAIYGRHSTSFQNPMSSDDQVRACRPLVERLGGEVIDVFTDPEMSGYRRDRPGLKALLNSVRTGEVDMVVCEALDRIARDGEDVAWLGKKLRFDRVGLHTTTEGEIDDVKLAVAGMMGALFLQNLRNKTIRGMEAAVLAGRFAGGRAYGYRLSDKVNTEGDRIRGLLEPDPVAAPIVNRIFNEFSQGKSAYTIARNLNADGIPGPRGGRWNQSSIRGDPKKLVGILHNPLYRGELVWGRREWRRDPDSETRARRYRIREETEWIRVEVPDLQIIDRALWKKVDREVERRQRPGVSGNSAGAMRKRHLLSGIIKCGACGGNFVINGKDYYRCASNREGGCESALSIRKSVIEEAALSVIRERLLTSEMAELFAVEFSKEVERLRASENSDGTRLKTRGLSPCHT